MSVLRPMTGRDVTQVLDVQQPGAIRALAEIFPQDSYPFPREELDDRWRREVADPEIDCTVVVLEDLVVGFAATRGSEFLHFGIAVEHWGSGLAVAAHDAVLERLRNRGVTEVWLRVFTANHRARRFYEKLGWQLTGTRTLSSFPPYPELLGYARLTPA
jgi:RimJ/RimL family protein N-acetyltransferase